MTAKKKTWTEKMNPDMEPKVKKVENDFADIPAGATMLIATPNIVADYIRPVSYTHLDVYKRQAYGLLTRKY